MFKSCIETKSLSAFQIYPVNKILLLDSEASDTLCQEDAMSFDYFVVGGILGDGIYFKFSG